MLLMIYLVVTAIVGFQAADAVGWPAVLGYGVCALASFFVGYQLVAAFLHVSGAKKFGYVAAQVALAALLLWLASLTQIVAGVFDFAFSAPQWIGLGLAVGGFNGFTTPPSAEEIADVNDQPMAGATPQRKSIEGLGSIETKEDQQKAIQLALNRVADFGDLMQKHANHVVVDASELPAPMEHMIPSFQVAYMTQQDPTIKEQIKIGFQELAKFHEGVGQPVDDFSVHVHRATEQHPDDIEAQARKVSGPEATAAQEWAEKVLAGSQVLADAAERWDAE